MPLPSRQMPNGARIALEHRPQAASVAVVARLAGGTREEDAASAGHLHLLEHLLLRRTARCDIGALAGRIAALGGMVNAQTGREHLALTGRAPAARATELTALLVECLCEPGFDEADLALEQGVIAAERTFVGQVPADEALVRLAWPDHPLGRPLDPPLPAPTDVAALRALLARQCAGSRLRVAVVGNFSAPEVLAALAPLADLPAGAPPAWGAPPRFVPGRYGELDETRPGRLWWALPCQPYTDDNGAGWALTAVALEHALTAALRHTGLAYAVAVWPELYTDAGLIIVRVAAPPGRVRACARAVDACLDGFGDRPPAADAVSTAREALAARAALAWDDLESRAHALASGTHESAADAVSPSAMPASAGGLRAVL